MAEPFEMASVRADAIAEVQWIMESVVADAPPSIDMPVWLDTADLLADFLVRASGSLCRDDTVLLLLIGGMLMRRARQVIEETGGSV